MSLNSVTKLVLISFQCLIVVAGSINVNIIDTGCHNDADCKEFVKMNQVANITCFNHQCICRDSDFKTIQCLPEKQGFANVIGGKCPCTNIKWSSCVDGFCMCKPDFIASADERSCISKKLPIGSRCENDAQCSKGTAFAACRNNTCSCQSEFALHNGTCQSLVVFERKKCANGTECAILPNTICVPEQCYCEPGYVAKFDKTACLPNADYNDTCSESVQCQHKLGLGAVCEHGKCVCGEDFYKMSFKVANKTKTICENRIAIGQMCVNNTDCFQSHFNNTEQSMYCYLKECHCVSDYEPDQDQRFCIKSRNTQVQGTWFDSFVTMVYNPFAKSSGIKSYYFINYWGVVLIGVIASLIAGS